MINIQIHQMHNIINGGPRGWVMGAPPPPTPNKIEEPFYKILYSQKCALVCFCTQYTFIHYPPPTRILMPRNMALLLFLTNHALVPPTPGSSPIMLWLFYGIMIHQLICNHYWLQFGQGSRCDNYIPEKRKFSGILCFRQQRSRRVVSRVTISLSAR